MKKCLDKQTSPKTGERYALVDNGNGTFSVMTLCSNYDGHVPGGVRQTWRVSRANPKGGSLHFEVNVDEATARKFFSKRTGK